MRLSNYTKGTFLVDEENHVFIHDGFMNADGYGVVIGENSDGIIRKSNYIGNWMKYPVKGMATGEQISEFLSKVRKTTTIVDY